MTDLVKRLEKARRVWGPETDENSAITEAITALSPQAVRDEGLEMAAKWHEDEANYLADKASFDNADCDGDVRLHLRFARAIRALKQQPTEAQRMEQRTGPDDMPGFFATLTPEQQDAALAYRGDDGHPQPAPQASLVAWFEKEWGRHPNEWIRQASTPEENATREAYIALLRELDRRLNAMGGK